MGYRGKVEERARARELRAEAWTLAEIASELGVARGTVSVWVRDVAFMPRPRNRGQGRAPHPQHLARLAEIERLRAEGLDRISRLSDRDLLIAGVALYAGEGAKTDGSVVFANSDPRMIHMFVMWLRQFFEVDESRLRLRLYLHEGLDLAEASAYWTALTGIHAAQLLKPYRAVPDSTLRSRKHPMGCPSVRYACSATHRAIMALVDALLAFPRSLPG